MRIPDCDEMGCKYNGGNQTRIPCLTVGVNKDYTPRYDTGILTVKWRDEWNKNATRPFTLYFKAWCPDFIFVVDKLLRISKWQAFLSLTNLRCFSSFDDYAAHKNLPLEEIKKQQIFRGREKAVDAARAIDTCEWKKTRGETRVWEENKEAWENGHDVSCTSESGYQNQDDTTPAIVIDGKKYCETEEILQWLEVNKNNIITKSSSSRHTIGLAALVALGLIGGLSG